MGSPVGDKPFRIFSVCIGVNSIWFQRRPSQTALPAKSTLRVETCAGFCCINASALFQRRPILVGAAQSILRVEAGSLQDGLP